MSDYEEELSPEDTMEPTNSIGWIPRGRATRKFAADVASAFGINDDAAAVNVAAFIVELNERIVQLERRP